jgi:pilus assembly protein TadC
MSPRFYLWLQSLAQRDQAFVELTGLTLTIVLAWLGIDYMPMQLRPFLRRTYLVGGIGLYIVTIILTIKSNH